MNNQNSPRKEVEQKLRKMRKDIDEILTKIKELPWAGMSNEESIKEEELPADFRGIESLEEP